LGFATAEENVPSVLLVYPQLRCLHLSETPVPRIHTSLPNRQKYRVPLSWASAGHPERHSFAGTGQDIYYSIWQEDQFPRLEELEHTDNYQYAYMFNAPRAYRHTGTVREKVLVFHSHRNFWKTDKALGAGIFGCMLGMKWMGVQDVTIISQKVMASSGTKQSLLVGLL